MSNGLCLVGGQDAPAAGVNYILHLYLTELLSIYWGCPIIKMMALFLLVMLTHDNVSPLVVMTVPLFKTMSPLTGLIIIYFKSWRSIGQCSWRPAGNTDDRLPINVHDKAANPLGDIDEEVMYHLVSDQLTNEDSNFVLLMITATWWWWWWPAW